MLFYKKIGYDKKVVVVLAYCLILFITVSIHKYIPEENALVFLLYQSWFTFVEYLSFALLFFFLIANKKFKKIIIVLSACFVVFQIIFILTMNSKNLDSVAVGVETILVFLFIFYFLYQEFKKESQLLIKNSMFWISIGIFFYLAGSFFFNILANHMTRKQLNQYWYYSFLFDIIKNILIAIGLSIHKQKQPPASIPYLDLDLNHTKS